MAHKNDAPGRDVEKFERWGIAPSLAFGLGSATRFTVNYFHQTDDNIPQYGVPYFSAYGGTLPGVDNANYYGYRNIDTQDIDLDMLTGVFEQDFSDNTTLRSLARYQHRRPAEHRRCAAGHVVPRWLRQSVADTGRDLPGWPGTGHVPSGAPSGPRGYVRDTRNSIAISQTDLTTRFDDRHGRARAGDGPLVHAARPSTSTPATCCASRTAHGAAAADVDREPRQRLRRPAELHPYQPDRGNLDNHAVYVFDTLQFDEHWMLNLGARYEHNEGDTVVDTFDIVAEQPDPRPTHRRTVFENEDNLFSWRASVVYKPVEKGTVYLSYSDSKTPSKASVNGACTAQTCNVDPETAVTIELGTKWDISNRLAINAAVFRNEREEFKVADPGNPANPSGEQQLDGDGARGRHRARHRRPADARLVDLRQRHLPG
jgi:catecholate siderophore receptor